jgi:hypothetical protein
MQRRRQSSDPQKSIALLSDSTHSLLAAGRMLTRDQSQIAGDLFAALESADVPDRQHES